MIIKKAFPNEISNLALHNLLDSKCEINGQWQPARPISYPSLLKRLQLSWAVFTGKADALFWINQ